MRTRTDIFLEKLKAYLKAFFDKECSRLGIETVKDYQLGFVSEPLTASSQYPSSLLLVMSKNAVDAYTATFNCSVAVAVTADDMAILGERGLLWADILEDAIRSDYHLGGACLDVEDNFRIMTSYADDLMVIVVEFDAEIDLGGYVYAEEPAAEGKAMEGLQEMRLSDGEAGSSPVSEV